MGVELTIASHQFAISSAIMEVTLSDLWRKLFVRNDFVMDPILSLISNIEENEPG